MIDANPNNFALADMDTTAFGVYAGGGMVKQVANKVTGLNYLLGEYGQVGRHDGAILLQSTTVTGDSLDLPYYANLITVGIPYKYKLQPTNPVLRLAGSHDAGDATEAQPGHVLAVSGDGWSVRYR